MKENEALVGVDTKITAITITIFHVSAQTPMPATGFVADCSAATRRKGSAMIVHDCMKDPHHQSGSRRHGAA
jgi:hypothetical protein